MKPKSFMLTFLIAITCELNGQTLRTALPDTFDIKNSDPAISDTGPTSQFFTLIYSPLIYIDDYTGKLRSRLTKRFYWNGNDLIFDIKPNIKTRTGEVIDADTVIKSFKRSFIVAPENATPLVQELCPGGLKSINDPCKNIRIKNNSVIFAFERKTPLIITRFASDKFSIIPKKAYDSKTLKITDFANTTGHFYINSSTKNGDRYILKRNFHLPYKKGTAKTIEVLSYNSSLEYEKQKTLVRNGQIDLLPYNNELTRKDIQNLSNEVKGTSLVVSDELTSLAIKFTNRGLALPQKQKFQVAAALRTRIAQFRKKLSKEKGTYGRAINQLIPVGIFGHLPPPKEKEVVDFWTKQNSAWPDDLILEVSMGASTVESFRKLLAPLNDHLLYKIDEAGLAHPSFAGREPNDFRTPHLAIVAFGSSAYETLSSATAKVINAEYFYVRGEEAKSWVQEYAATDDASQRLEKYRKLHFESLTSKVSVIPMASKPFISLVGPKLNPSQIPKGVQILPLWDLEIKK
ncbi:MAG: hypothetical protein HRU19_32675 [Pseudobacteriovorax sp.]|nr:hypothetical protein [Pseudobacteriovorax sp.]